LSRANQQRPIRYSAENEAVDMHSDQAVIEAPAAGKDTGLNIMARSFFAFRRSAKALRLFLAIAGPGIIVMVADNDAGGITTYTATGAQYGCISCGS
jgi:hypothetical protein